MTKICKNCGWHGEPKALITNNGIIEILLWLILFIAGAIYSIVSRIKLCPSCKSTGFIDTNTPKGKELMEKHKKIN